MKILTANALTEIAKQYATEPVTIVEIAWEISGGISQYSDKKILGIDGLILSVGSVESALTIQQVQTAQVNVSLDDSDGQIKVILDRTDIHKKSATIYQWYGGLVDADKFIVFKGQISTPFEWKEKARSIDFTVLSQVESFQIGFSPEEGQLDFVAPDLEGNAWPLAIGRVKNIPATRVSQKKVAFLLESLGRVDILLFQRLRDLESDYGRESFMLHFWILVMRGANALAPDVSWILNEYVKAIINEDRIRPTILAATQLLIRTRQIVQRIAAAGAPVAPVTRQRVRNLQNVLVVLAAAANAIRIRKKVLEEMCRLAEFEYEQKKRAAQNQINTYNNLREIHADYLAVWKEICSQSELLKTCVKTKDGGTVFGTGANVDVVINKVKFRVTFDSDDIMCYVAGPLTYDDNVKVATWKVDDEPCSNIEDIDGANLFWLEETYDVNGDPEAIPQLEDTWILVKKRGTDDTDGFVDRHILKVIKQVGLKVYFELKEWDKGGSGGFPREMSLAGIIREVVDTPFYPGPFGYWYPEGFFTGDYDPNVWNRPEAAMLLSILQVIGPVNKDELTTLTKLVFLLPNDILGDTIFAFVPGLRDIFTIIGEDVESVIEVSGLIPEGWLTRFTIPYEELPESLFWKADSGARIEEEGPDCDIYIANILPSTIKAVNAYRTNEEGLRFLAPVPSRYYIKNENANLGAINVTSLTFPRSLNLISGEQWEETVYVSLISSIGPSVVDYIQHIIETYTDKTVNASNFSTIKAKLQSGGEELYPADFCTFERPDALEEIRRTAWEARLGVLLVNDEIFLKYLSEEPTQDTTLGEADFELDSLTIEYTRTEELVTVLTSTYKNDYLELESGDEEPKVVLRHNVKKYGAHQSKEFFHIYTNRELVLKSATFWLIRYSNTWKKVSVKAFHSRLNVDTLDTILLQLSSAFVADVDIKCIVEQAVYDSASNIIDFTLHTGVRAGEMLPYEFFWPALGSGEFPTDSEILEGNAGGFGPGATVTGTIDDCPES